MDASVLAQVLRELPPIDDPNVLVGTSTADDAGVFRISDALALVQTVDFFTPIVDDPRSFGRIAAANALSDIYAMGAKPLTALAIAAFPEDVDPRILGEILAGGAEKAKEAGISVIGGHTVKDAEPKYGLSVTGVVHPLRVVRNDTGVAGDALLLTKPLGTGILTTARRRDAIDDDVLAPAIESMERLNRVAGEIMVEHHAHAATDISGFGFIGHLLEMTPGSLGAEIWASAVPIFARALELAGEGIVPGGSRTNRSNALRAHVVFDDAISEAMQLVLCDAQTSGGLLMAVDQSNRQAALESLNARGIAAAHIGNLSDSGKIDVR